MNINDAFARLKPVEELAATSKVRLVGEYLRIRWYLRRTRKGKLTNKGLKGRLLLVKCLILGKPAPVHKPPVVRIFS